MATLNKNPGATPVEAAPKTRFHSNATLQARALPITRKSIAKSLGFKRGDQTRIWHIRRKCARPEATPTKGK
ncbi:hypothetical protein CAF53_22755 [Sphingobium sp. LB126]|jgi:hypothetical protein|uniref:hypothetical protein n=1 Tax=Sphingobium TaxID=165695 RepID=UPI000C206CE8|nr:hypothetical protein [Sphingobium sp. LB126]PJG45556.1 hypothetical protein CAF53_22755 [Sphingobium sp. LB126]